MIELLIRQISSVVFPFSMVDFGGGPVHVADIVSSFVNSRAEHNVREPGLAREPYL